MSVLVIGMRDATTLGGHIFLSLLACTALARSQPSAGTADHLAANESDYLNTQVTVSVEEGISEIAQDASRPIDLAKVFFTLSTVDAETHKRGGTINAAFTKSEAEAARDYFSKFPERTRTLTGVFKKTKPSGTLYLDCKIIEQLPVNSAESGKAAVADSATVPDSWKGNDEVKNRALSSTVVIRTKSGGGSGFVVEEQGKKFVVTNQHVLLGSTQNQIEILTTSGTTIRPKSLQIVPDRDLARMEISEGPPPLLVSSEVTIDEPVATVGNSLDAGVVTINAGTVKGIGGGEVEVSCEVVPGQSGGPLINVSGDVIGVTTYITFADKSKISEGTRYEKKRYFTVRMSPTLSWTSVASWAEYAKVGATVGAGEELFDHALDIAISADDGPRSDYVYSGENPKLLEAVRQHNLFANKMSRMSGAIVSASELKRNNASLATNFRGVYKAVLEACEEQRTLLRRELASGRSKIYPWLLKRIEETESMLSLLVQGLESRSKARPNFLSW